MSIAKKILESKKVIVEAEDKTSGALKALADAKPSDDNKDQGKFAELIKGMAFSDDPKATAFMKKLMSTVSPAYVGGKEKKDEGLDESQDEIDQREEAIAELKKKIAANHDFGPADPKEKIKAHQNAIKLLKEKLKK